MRVIKIGGHQIDDPDFVQGLARVVAGARERPVIVHGGGRDIAELQSRLGLETVKVDGLRVTDEASLAVAEMVLSGRVNKLLVAALLGAGVDALGLSGVDRGLLRCDKKLHPRADLGLVGQIVEVRRQVIADLLEQGVVPVVSPISLGRDGRTYNVNADEAAVALAAALPAETLDFVSNVPGVLVDGAVVESLSPGQAEEWIAEGVIGGGMVPKVRAALAALEQGAAAVRIVDLAGLESGGGTRMAETAVTEGIP